LNKIFGKKILNKPNLSSEIHFHGSVGHLSAGVVADFTGINPKNCMG
jgi:hypothetical protein